MMITGNTLFAFVDSDDPFMPSPIAGEEQVGPILSLMESRSFSFIFLFHTEHTRKNAHETAREIAERHDGCHVALHALPDSDLKDVSSLVDDLSRQVRKTVGESKNSKNHVSMSSGTPETRAALFLLVAAGVLPATLLELGSPAERLFGPPKVKEVHLRAPDATSLRGLVMPGTTERETALPETEQISFSATRFPGLEDALKELQICIGSAVMQTAAERIAIAAPTDLPVLLLGESGTGKEGFARLTHRLSGRKGYFVAVNSAAVPKDLTESLLFGHVKGAFSGATTDRIGQFEFANGGTLFLDEVGDLGVEAQAKLLRALQEREIQRLGAVETRKVDVRVVAATNHNLQLDMADGRFREDLYFRLNGVEVKLPPLRERREEIPQLASEFLAQANKKLKRQKSLAKEALLRLTQHTWPGNVRELNGVMQESVLFSKGQVIHPEDLTFETGTREKDFFEFLPEPWEGFKMKEFTDALEMRLISKALSMSGGNQAKAAKLLGMTRQAISQRISQLSLQALSDSKPA